MRASTWTAFCALAVGITNANEILRPAVPAQRGERTSQGCYKSMGDWKEYPVAEMSSGGCGIACAEKDFMVAGLLATRCYCGNNYPPEDDVVEDSKCDQPCQYYNLEACGGIKGGKYYSVYNTGLDEFVEHKESAKSSSSASSKPAESTKATGGAGSGDSSTPSPTNAPAEGGDSKDGDNEDSSGPSVGGIIGGVIAGVAILAIGGGVAFWWFRRRRNQDIEEEHRRNAAVNSFIAGGKPPSSSGGLSMTDSRMDPVMAHRRLSDGSIADNHDYSRKILRVTNA